MYCTSVYIKDKEAVVVCVYVCVCVWDSIFVYTGRKELLDLTQKAKAEIGAVRPAASASRTGPKEHIPPPRPQARHPAGLVHQRSPHVRPLPRALPPTHPSPLPPSLPPSCVQCTPTYYTPPSRHACLSPLRSLGTPMLLFAMCAVALFVIGGIALTGKRQSPPDQMADSTIPGMGHDQKD